MNRLQEAKYEMITNYDYHRYFCLPEEIKKNTDIVKICFKKYHDSVRKISTIFGEYLNYHDITDQGSLELIIMLNYLLTEQQKKAMSFNMYEEVLNNIVKTSDFEELYEKYKNKTVLHFLIDKHLELLFRAFKIDNSSVDNVILDILNHIDPMLATYLNEHKNLLNKYVVEKEKKLTK